MSQEGIPRVNAGDISTTLKVRRGGKKLENKQKQDDLVQFLRAWEIYESVEAGTVEATFMFEDSAGISNIFTGSELITFTVKGSVLTRTYNLRSFNVHSRQRINQTTDTFVVNCCSDEFVKNECTNVFGRSDTIFQDTEASSIVKKLIKEQQYLGSSKKIFAEETLTKHQFIAPNWRPMDTIYWVANRAVRKKKSGGKFQNGFTFYENALGYHFKSIDGMIDDINKQSVKTKTDLNKGTSRLYEYLFSPKKTDDGSNDQFKIDTIQFPEERNFLMGLRHGAWSGFGMGIDPIDLAFSKMGGDTVDLPLNKDPYSLSTSWSQMSHLGKKKAVNPVSRVGEDYKTLVEAPRRMRYSVIPRRIFDVKKNVVQQVKDKVGTFISGEEPKPGNTYAELVELQSYQFLRIESMKNTQLQISVPGNLDLYAGSGVSVTIPTTEKSGDKIETDKQFSGRYMIVTLAHKGTPDTMSTEMLLMKDTVL